MLLKLKVLTIASVLLALPVFFAVGTAQAAPLPDDTHTNKPADPATTKQTDPSTIGGSQTYSDPATSSNNCSNVNKCDLITKYVNPLINVLAAMVGIAVVISLVIGGIQYGSSAGDPQKVALAKKRIQSALIALITFIFLYALINFLIPGGLV